MFSVMEMMTIHVLKHLHCTPEGLICLMLCVPKDSLQHPSSEMLFLSHDLKREEILIRQQNGGFALLIPQSVIRVL